MLVPGHGPVTDASGVRDVRRYLRFVRDEARKRFLAGVEPGDAADDIDISDFADWGYPERLAANVVPRTASSIRRGPLRRRLSCSSRWRAGARPTRRAGGAEPMLPAPGVNG